MKQERPTFFSAAMVKRILDKNSSTADTTETTIQNFSAEDIGFENIQKSFKKIFPEARLLKNVILPMEDDGLVKTAEYDVMVVCAAGIHIFEIKGYPKGKVWYEKGENGLRLWKIDNGTTVSEIHDPISQGLGKLYYIRKSVQCFSKYYVYFTGDEIDLEPTMPATVLTTDELPYVSRLAYSDAKFRKSMIKKEEVDVIADAILEISSQYTIVEHISNCREFHKHKHAA
ncbi:nuclease-related domain-containing protein [Giesbergeria anulus]|uniref:Nuclease-related domain-containing protein n=1 Tax=Giesbergeria anulus TaxID=180197 RepID=A0A1H9NFN9_9BURK|nr:nuclease-related domain-containing protein [Giesbergeria anulus]SER34794.1 Nuclease-related domain-containing protein [Giesbergeria anulus]